MSFLSERAAFERELETHYSAYPSDLSAVEQELHAHAAQHPEWLPYTHKAAGYALIAQRCQIKLFRHFPFYFELDTGRARTDLGAGGVGGWMKREPLGQQLETQGREWLRLCHTTGLSNGWPVLDDNHHCVGNDNVLRCGLNGLIRQAQERLRSARTEKERAFLQAVIAGNQALIAIAHRFADEAERLLSGESDPELRRRLQQIAEAARVCPAEPPTTFYQALNTLLFMREIVQELEGNGNSSFGHLDRILWPFYQCDLAAGRLTPEEAEDLLRFFLAFSDVRFGMRHTGKHVGTNTTVVIGGCDATGTPVFNDLTRMIVRIYRDLRLVDPKLNARASSDHPTEFLYLLADLTLSSNKALAIYNDPVVIAANAKMGKALEDCRLYVGGGCQENLLENTEVNSRATIYLNLAQVFLMGFYPEHWSSFSEQGRFSPVPYGDCTTFEQFYDIFLRNLRAVVDAHVEQRNRTEREGWHYNPCPLHSSTLSDCIAKGLDMMEGGARYSYSSVSLVGVGTLADSLQAVRRVVFEEGRVSLAQLRDLLAANLQGEEALRQYLIHRIPKFGHEDVAMRAFSAQVFANLAHVCSGQPNTRGGRYEASLFSFRTFTDLGQRTGATPDGRLAGEYLSPGMSPSPLALGQACSVGQILSALEPLDLTLYPVVAVLDVKLPAAPDYRPELLVPVIRRFLESGGSVLQINYIDPAMLQEARQHPERHPDLVVRVSGYSAYFNTLPEAIQDEIIARTWACA